ncbi:rhomboid family intramembrane serine protease [Clostridium peptidivorans]|uniref:rhomboid family intramembrane serine protease n=1 Tax=Clostridium peptidivorans TaxID=100174 RepID=UPI000BE3CDF9|nr:rhomboid family intramembrane serine protease [Clostridium peptidivorans]
MNEFITYIIEVLTKHLGYTLMELESDSEGIASPWALLKEGQEGDLRGVVFCRESYSVSDDNWVKYNFSKNTNSSFVKITRIYLIDGEIAVRKTMDEANSNLLNGGNYIAVDLQSNTIPFYTEYEEEILQTISYYLNRGNIVQDEEKEKEEKPIITYILIGLNVIMYLITAFLSGNIIDSNTGVLVFLGAKVNTLIDKGQYYRLITAAFLHGGLIHIGFNMYALNALGPLVERVFGKVKYLIIYFVAAITSSYLSYIFSTSISVGASGAIFGLLGASLVFAVKSEDKVGRTFINNIMSVIVVNLIIGFSMANVDNFGHIGGLIGGFVMSLILYKHV